MILCRHRDKALRNFCCAFLVVEVQRSGDVVVLCSISQRSCLQVNHTVVNAEEIRILVQLVDDNSILAESVMERTLPAFCTYS